MKKVVVKFGGSNLKSRADIQRIVERVRLYDRPLVIVVSAFYGVTDYLSRGIRAVRGDESRVGEIVAFLRSLKVQAIDENIDSLSAREEAYALVAKRLDEVERCLLGVHYIGDIPNFVEDRVLSYGERLSSLLLSLILRYRGLDARECLPEDMGLVTDGEFSNGTIDFGASCSSVQEALRGDGIYVVPGFYGVSDEGKVTLLGRGGSDYSAAGLACCLGAESLDIWKDVNGFMSADPKLVPQASRVEALSYTEAAELSYFGAKILHPRTVEPLEEPGIPVRVFNINGDAGVLCPLSIIGPDVRGECSSPKSVTYSDDFAILRVAGPGVGIKPGILARITEAMDRKLINIKSVVTSQTAINFYLESADLPRAMDCCRALKEQTIKGLQGIDDMSIVSLVGAGIAHEPLGAHRMLQALARVGIHTQIVSLGASDVAAYVVVNHRDREEAVRAVHREFFEQEFK